MKNSSNKPHQQRLTLGIESSCDETGLALYHEQHGLLGQRVYSQGIHAEYGGVVPELASRDHVRKALPLLHELLDQCQVQPQQINGIGYTAGPGLIGALLVGNAMGRALAFAWDKPSIAVHHMEGHLLAPLLEDDKPSFPFLALLISGGHTLLIQVDGIGRYRILGDTLDDAVGEAFDKTAKLLGLGYPGGPALAALAEHGDPTRYRFPRPMTDRPGLDFSFSGLKTFSLNLWQKERSQYHSNALEQCKADIARCFEEAVADTLRIKCRRALEQTGLKQLVIAGGVGANLRIRAALQAMMESQQGRLYYPRLELCTDNGAMIAFAAHLRLKAGQCDADLSIHPRARWSLEDLPPLTPST